jgi:hypothetical protein
MLSHQGAVPETAIGTPVKTNNAARHGMRP